jgi:hypothetical protein
MLERSAKVNCHDGINTVNRHYGCDVKGTCTFPALSAYVVMGKAQSPLFNWESDQLILFCPASITDASNFIDSTPVKES